MKNPKDASEAVFRTDARRDLGVAVLVLNAAGIGFEIRRDVGVFEIVVAPDDVARSRAEFDAYARENPDRAPVPTASPIQASGWPGVFGYVAVLVIVEVSRSRGFLGADWVAAGKAHAGWIQEGQWWRTLTALTLHADLLHLAGNIVFGALFGLFAGQLLGSGLAWLTILITGAMGNYLNAWIHQSNHTSVGASTAVFATLGLIAAISWRRRALWRVSRLARWAPIVAAAVLLSFLGTGGVRTDVLAHVTGFLSGLVIGAVYGRLGERIRFGIQGQTVCGLSAIGALAAAWALAMQS